MVLSQESGQIGIGLEWSVMVDETKRSITFFGADEAPSLEEDGMMSNPTMNPELRQTYDFELLQGGQTRESCSRATDQTASV